MKSEMFAGWFDKKIHDVLKEDDIDVEKMLAQDLGLDNVNQDELHGEGLMQFQAATTFEGILEIVKSSRNAMTCSAFIDGLCHLKINVSSQGLDKVMKLCAAIDEDLYEMAQECFSSGTW